jgi:hypothetical protein
MLVKEQRVTMAFPHCCRPESPGRCEGRLATAYDAGAARARRPSKAFTIVEVTVATAVLALGITTALMTLQRGMQALDTARHLGLAAQVMQSEFERLRLKNWDQIQSLQDAAVKTVSIAQVANEQAESMACQRSIRDLKPDMKEIMLVCNWKGYDGRAHSVQYITRYGKSGLYDYFYTAH